MVSVSEWLRTMTNQEQHQLVEELMYLLPDLPFHVGVFFLTFAISFKIQFLNSFDTMNITFKDEAKFATILK